MFQGTGFDPALVKFAIEHCDGATGPSRITPEDAEFFRAAMAERCINIVQRMKEIDVLLQMPSEELERQGVTDQDMEGVMEELQDILCDLDNAKDFFKIGAFPHLLALLQRPSPPLQWRAAETIALMVQNVQDLQARAMEAGSLPALLAAARSEDSTVRLRSLGAISCLVRGNKPAGQLFLENNGAELLRDSLRDPSLAVRRKGMQMLASLLQESATELAQAMLRLGFLTDVAAAVKEQGDPDLPVAALLALQALASVDGRYVNACRQDVETAIRVMLYN
eukprot:jgi/Mesvir1/6553/Mv16812-RA.1